MGILRSAARPTPRPTISREVVVTARERITAHMLRLTLGGDDLAPAVHDSPGSWIKLFVPRAGEVGEHGRAYTVRGFDPVRDEVIIDVFVHEGGTMPRWAIGARIGEPARIGGPRSGGAPDETAASLLLLADETALPAVAAILARERGGRPVRAFIEIGDPRDRQELEAPTSADIAWLDRGTHAPGTPLAAAAARLELGPDAGVWFAAEAHAAQVMRRMLRTQAVAQAHVQGYWRRGVGDYRE